MLEYCDCMASNTCSHASLVDFGRHRLLQQMHLTILAHGNTGAEEALALAQESERRLGGGLLLRSQMPTLRLLQVSSVRFGDKAHGKVEYR